MMHWGAHPRPQPLPLLTGSSGADKARGRCKDGGLWESDGGIFRRADTFIIDEEEEEERDEEEVEISSLFHLVLSLMFGSTDAGGRFSLDEHGASPRRPLTRTKMAADSGANADRG